MFRRMGRWKEICMGPFRHSVMTVRSIAGLDLPLLVVAPTLEPGHVVDDHRVRLSRHHCRVIGLVLAWSQEKLDVGLPVAARDSTGDRKFCVDSGGRVLDRRCRRPSVSSAGAECIADSMTAVGLVELLDLVQLGNPGGSGD